MTRHESQTGEPGALGAHVDAERCGVVAGGERGMLELKLGGVALCLTRVEAPAAFLQQRFQAIGNAGGDGLGLGPRRRR